MKYPTSLFHRNSGVFFSLLHKLKYMAYTTERSAYADGCLVRGNRQVMSKLRSMTPHRFRPLAAAVTA